MSEFRLERELATLQWTGTGNNVLYRINLKLHSIIPKTYGGVKQLSKQSKNRRAGCKRRDCKRRVED